MSAAEFVDRYGVTGERLNTIVQGSGTSLTTGTIAAAIKRLQENRIPTREEQDAREARRFQREVHFGTLFGVGAQERSLHEYRCGRLEGALAGILCRKGHQL